MQTSLKGALAVLAAVLLLAGAGCVKTEITLEDPQTSNAQQGDIEVTTDGNVEIIIEEPGTEENKDSTAEEPGTEGAVLAPMPAIDANGKPLPEADGVNEMVVEKEPSNTEDVTAQEETTPTMATPFLILTGKNFEYSVKEMRVKKGAKVTVNFTSEEGFHDWVLDEFNARTGRVQSTESTSVTFVADKVGTFEYYCSMGNHRALGMTGKLIVEE